MVRGDQLSHEATKPSKLFRHMETIASKDKPLEFFKRKKKKKKSKHKEQKQLLEATAASKVSALTASFRAAGRTDR